MKKEVIACFAGAAVCHLVMLFGFRIGTAARPLPLREESSPVDLNLVAVTPEAVVEPSPLTEPPHRPDPTPMPTPEPAAIPTPDPSLPESAPPVEPPTPQPPHPSIPAIAKPSRPPTAAGRSNNVAARTGSVTTAHPRYRSNPPPEYPVEARRLHQEGVVILGVEVSADGRPSNVRIKHGSGVRVLDQAALEAVQKWTFEPARIGGLPIASTVDIPLRFTLAR